MKTIYRDLFDHDVKVSACHAGLECGVIAIAYPDLAPAEADAALEIVRKSLKEL